MALWVLKEQQMPFYQRLLGNLSMTRGLKPMKQSILAVGITLAALAGVNAYAASITVSNFDISSFNTLTANGIVENFESYTTGNWDSGTVTNVGKFRAAGGTGSGSTCTNLGGNCQQLYLSATTINGQGNLFPLDGSKALQANDTLGIIWDVSNKNGKVFDRILFGINDATDNGATLTIEASWTVGNTLTSISKTLSGLPNNNKQMVEIDLGGLFSGAQVKLVNNKINDSFTLDAASTVSTVPVPAALPLFISALAGLGFAGFRRRNA
jgi:hypothetical protein